MPKRNDLQSVLVIGSGPIVIGQACEFDYSGTQACKALREEGIRVILVNSNPATIMTDPEFSDRTYIEPLTVFFLEKIIARERPDALLPTIGGQTALNLALELSEKGVLQRYKVELIGASVEAIRRAEDRDLFKQSMKKIGLETPRSEIVRSVEEARRVLERISLPLIIRPSRTLGGTGGNVAWNEDDFDEIAAFGLAASPIHEVLLEESVFGWKEFELEVMRDQRDNVVVVCTIENFDPMGVHTGDSITVAPAQTLTDKEYQIMRDAALKIIREIGVDTGGSNIQFAINPADGRMVVIEMNPRVSRSSALASKATGFPIAKIAAKLAVGYTLDEIPNDITRETFACFEPTIDYVVTKIPRFAFEKFPQAKDILTTQMKSVGEAMAIGRTFKESLQKAIRSLELGSDGFEQRVRREDGAKGLARIRGGIRTPNAQRLWFLADALRLGMGIEEIYEMSGIDPWFLKNIQQILEFEERYQAQNGDDESLLREAKRKGFSDVRLAFLSHKTEDQIRQRRKSLGIEAVFRTVDTCGAEFEAYTPYLYSTYEGEDESKPTHRKKILILGSGPNRIGQGIEFDYCCVHAAFALKEDGFETIMVNCNPETVSTDYDTADKLYFEPLTKEDVLNIIDREDPDGVILQFGGQTPLKLAFPLERAGVHILGTSPDSIDRAEDRERFRDLIQKLGLKQPQSGVARSEGEAASVAKQIGYPVLVRPSYVLGGRAMELIDDEENLRRYMSSAFEVFPDHPILIDRFLEEAIELDVDAISDGETVVIGGIMEHVEPAGIHSGDSACRLPPGSVTEELLEEIRRQIVELALELRVVGLMNVQMALKEGEIYILEVNPRASRTIPFVSKAIGIPLAKLAARVMVGRTLRELGFTQEIIPTRVAVKEAILPFNKFPGVDTLLGPEMKSTGEAMGIARNFGLAFAKAQLACGMVLPTKGRIFISVRDEDKPRVLGVAKRLHEAGLEITATEGTQSWLVKYGVPADKILKIRDGSPNVQDAIRASEISLVINTPGGRSSVGDSYYIRRAALDGKIPYFTTMAGAEAAAESIGMLTQGDLEVCSLQEYLGA